ncbi:hypothetical protein [uncultured Paracoccus sp.]|uniref:hypothetical protein n=1 Tax=uncultured Paracoccus sp. TaxID=189685 RepID=UPI002634F55C|nr:hypothetical protein [uncultured Paracoccus sp.]
MSDHLDRKGRHLAHARAHALDAARLLRLLAFQSHPRAPVFMPGISTYADMLDPDAPDERRLAACHRYLEPVQRAATREQLSIHAERPSEFRNPYGLELQTTQRGYLLELCHRHLGKAVLAFLAAGVDLR